VIWTKHKPTLLICLSWVIIHCQINITHKLWYIRCKTSTAEASTFICCHSFPIIYWSRMTKAKFNIIVLWETHGFVLMTVRLWWDFASGCSDSICITLILLCSTTSGIRSLSVDALIWMLNITYLIYVNTEWNRKLNEREICTGYHDRSFQTHFHIHSIMNFQGEY
jgi:hypothetical protein